MSSTQHRIARQAVMVAGWLISALTTGDVIDTAVGDLTSTGRVIIALVAWSGWLAVLVATFVRLPITLTVLRLGSTVGSAWAIVAAGVADVDAAGVVGAVAPPLVVAVVALTPLVGQAWVDGAAYGDEVRFCLRAPVPLFVGPIPIAWSGVATGVGLGPVLLANEQWVVGGVACVIGAALVGVGGRALHGLARRWLVLVPAGVVVHDRLATREPFLMVRAIVESIGPAPADADATAHDRLDATGQAAGPVIEIELSKVVETVPRPSPGESAEVRRVRSILLVPSRPVEFVKTAHRRGLG